MLINKSPAVKVHKSFGYKDYYWVNKNGKVFKITKDKDGKDKVKEMSPFITKDGYVEYVLTDNQGNKKHKQAQLIVLTSFKGLPVGKKEANHKDKKRYNNKLSNLEWLTPSQNIKHSFDNGKVIWNKGKKKVNGKYI